MNRILAPISGTRILCNGQYGFQRLYLNNFVACRKFFTSKISTSSSSDHHHLHHYAVHGDVPELESSSKASPSLTISSVNPSHSLQHIELYAPCDSSTRFVSLSRTHPRSETGESNVLFICYSRTCYGLRILSNQLLTKDLFSSFNLNARSFHSLTHYNLLLQSTSNSCTSKRSKYNRSADDDEESDDEYDDLSDDENFFDEDADLPNNYRDLTVHVKSLRLDAILAQGLNVARNKVDEHFLGSNLELNGNRVLKKGKQLSEGDYIDVITSNDGEARRFKRVRITNVSSKTTKSDRKVVQLRVWRANITKDKN